MMLAGERVTFRVSGKRVGERAIEIGDLHRLKVIGEFHRGRSGLHNRKGGAAEADHIGVCGEGRVICWPI
jgi:hypothetical protein